MEMIKEIIAWTLANYEGIFVSLTLIIAGLEVGARITPTKKDDSALERIGGLLRKAMDFLKIPNVKIEDKRVGKHEPRV